MKLVFDTNVLFAAFVARQGLCATIVEAALAEHDLYISLHIIDELARILEQKAHVERALIVAAIDALTAGCVRVEPLPISPGTLRDLNDAPIIGTALAARAEFLVSGDNDLLVLKAFQSIPIVSPRDFYDRYIAP